MNSRGKIIKYFALFLALAVFLTPILNVRALSIEQIEEKISSLDKDKARLDIELKKYKSIVNEKKKEINSLKNQIALMDAEILRLEVDIQKTEAEINSKNLEINLLELKIKDTESDIESQKANIAETIRTIYETDDTTLLEIVLKTDNFSEILNQAEYLDRLQKNLKQAVDQLMILKTNLEDNIRSLEESKKELEADKNQLEIQQQAIAGQKKQRSNILYKTKGEEKKYQSLLAEVNAKRSALLKEIKKLERQALIKKNFLIHAQAGTIPPPGTKIFQWPEEGAIFTQGYGMTSFAKKGSYGGSPHNGIDMSGPHGSPIMAAGDGKVLVSGTNTGWGNWIAIQHPMGLVTLYGHMMKPTHITTGTFVKAGTIIGYQGSTGYSTGSHLHFSVYSNFFTYKNARGEVYFNYFEGTLNPLDYL